MSEVREILRHSRYARNQVRELLQSLFVAELIRPSSELWLVSPWVSDIEVIDNRAGAFSALMDGREAGTLTLSAALARLAASGSQVKIVTRPEHSRDFVGALERRLDMTGAAPNVAIRSVETLHAKGLVGNDFRLMGSMNFTFNGIGINDELVRFDRDKQGIAQVRLEFARQYGEAHA